MRLSFTQFRFYTQTRPSVGTGAKGAKAPVNFEQLVLGTPPENGIIQFGTRPAKLPTEGLQTCPIKTARFVIYDMKHPT